MTIYQFIDLLKEIILLAGMVIGIAAVLFLVGYFFIYKKILHGTKTISSVQILLYVVMIFYFIGVYGVTFMGRVEGLDGGISTKLFWSYQYAWNSHVPNPWRNIILNIVMFVPLGFLLPVCFKACRRFPVTFVCGLVATGIIECTQYYTKRGLFEVDDLFNNTLGAVIGYGFFVIAKDIYQYIRKEKQQKTLWQVGLWQIPFILTVIFFLFAQAHSNAQKFGTLEIACKHRLDMGHVKISRDVAMTWDQSDACVYRTKEGTAVPARVDKTMLFLLEPVRVCRIISSEDAYLQILRGYIMDYGIADMSSIRVMDYEITYLKDSEDYYQPIFSFHCMVDGERELVIEVPAIA